MTAAARIPSGIRMRSPASRFEDTFGFHEVDEIERLPLKVRLELNDIYKNYGK